MKTYADLETALMLELKIWFKRQCLLPSESFYLYYQEKTSEHNGGIIILVDPPANKNYRLASAERINKGATIEQNSNYFRNSILGGLPVLG